MIVKILTISFCCVSFAHKIKILINVAVIWKKINVKMKEKINVKWGN